MGGSRAYRTQCPGLSSLGEWSCQGQFPHWWSRSRQGWVEIVPHQRSGSPWAFLPLCQQEQFLWLSDFRSVLNVGRFLHKTSEYGIPLRVLGSSLELSGFLLGSHSGVSEQMKAPWARLLVTGLLGKWSQQPPGGAREGNHNTAFLGNFPFFLQVSTKETTETVRTPYIVSPRGIPLPEEWKLSSFLRRSFRVPGGR